MTNPADQRQLVDLEPLAGTAPEAEPAPRHLDLDLVDRDLDPRREPFDDDDQRLSVRLAGRQKPKHRARLPSRARAPLCQFGLGDRTQQ